MEEEVKEEETPEQTEPKKKSKKSERRKSKEADNVRDEIKKFKENLLQSVSTGESIITENIPDFSPPVPETEASEDPEVEASPGQTTYTNVLLEIDENKLFELKEAFLLFDLDGDGCIDHADLRGTLISLGENVDDRAVKSMLSEAPNPLDFDGFVNLLGYKTLELDSEETLVEALSRWDRNNSGYISEERIRKDLMNHGDRFTEREADYALEEAPVIQKGGKYMIDYVRFCSTLSGLRKKKVPILAENATETA